MTFRNRRRILTALACLGLCASACSGPGSATRTSNQDAVRSMNTEISENEAWDNYYKTGYSYCDASVLSHYWGTEPEVAKAAFGRAAGTAELEAELEGARAVARKDELTCPYHESGYVYEDAEALAYYWGLEDPWEAKVRMEQKLLAGHNDIIRIELESAWAATEGPEHLVGDETYQVDMFYKAGYTYCDAWLVAHSWGAEAWDAKASIGYKLTNGYEDQISDILTAARTQAASENKLCEYSWGNMGYGYEDAELLARAWSTTTDEAKAMMAQKLTAGEDAAILLSLEAVRTLVDEENRAGGGGDAP